ncbi:MAG: hypothetical protein L7F77_11590 [Candidatus Magnetominusculus sp. LBB02]|nr:hypothetical protein [Candidatus Magnetominusculus sp. LBB02]
MNEIELYDACKVLFGKEVKVDRQFLDYIQPSGVKSAYRKMAMATHPDRLAVLGCGEISAAGDFRTVAAAYEKLSKYLKLRDSGYRLKYSYSSYAETVQSATKTWHNKSHYSAQTKTADNAAKKTVNSGGYFGGSTWEETRQKKSQTTDYAGNYGFTRKTVFDTGYAQKTSSYSYRQRAVPRRRLRLGEYLYYSGVVAWKDLIASIIWQTRQKQRLGEIAARWGWLTEAKILEIMKSRNRGERLGDALVRLKIITPFQCNMLVWQQQKSKHPIGKYFTGENLISENDLNRHLANLKLHNRNVAKPASSG